jgi:hypothetical protein
MMQSITVQLSEKMYENLKRVAELSSQSVDAIVEHSLAGTLPPLLEDIPPEFHEEVYPLLEMTDIELRNESQRRFPENRWETYETLLEKNQQGQLNPSEQEELARLRSEADILMFRKAYALVLLRRRGYDVKLNGKQHESL